jgi:hypothetical protein
MAHLPAEVNGSGEKTLFPEVRFRAMRRLGPGAFCLAIAVYFAAALWVDRYVDERQQLLLGAATWCVLLLACRGLPPDRLAQVALVVVVATCTEVVGSILWGVYEYRLGNLPAFVPPGHGLVYLTGLRLSECGFVRRRPRPFVLGVLAVSLTWTLAGLTVMPRLDVAGALGAVTFAACLFWGRAPAIYAGVFVAVATLEWYGTGVGTWRWAETIPGLGIPDGNPPSGVASGYVLFDVIAIALAPAALAFFRRLRPVPQAVRPRSGPVEGVWGNREVSPAAYGQSDS